MSKSQLKSSIRKYSFSDELDQIADLASAVANSIDEDAKGTEPQELQKVQLSPNYNTFPSTSAPSPFSWGDAFTTPWPASMKYHNEYSRKGLGAYTSPQKAISTRSLRTFERSPLLPLHSAENSDQTEAEPWAINSGRVAVLAAGSAMLVIVLFFAGVWLSEEFMLTWGAARNVLTTVTALHDYI